MRRRLRRGIGLAGMALTFLLAGCPIAGPESVVIRYTCTAGEIEQFGNSGLSLSVAEELALNGFDADLLVEPAVPSLVWTRDPFTVGFTTWMDAQAITDTVLEEDLRAGILLLTGSQELADTGFVELSIGDMTIDVDVPDELPATGTPTASSEPVGAPPVTATIVNGGGAVRTTIAGPVQTGAYGEPQPASVRPPTEPASAEVEFTVDPSTSPWGSPLVFRPGPVVADVTVVVGLIADGVEHTGGVTTTLSCAPEPKFLGQVEVIEESAFIPPSPTGVFALPGDASASVLWDEDPSGLATDWTVTASPGGATCTTRSNIQGCTVFGLTNGIEHTFTVVASNQQGDSPPSAPSAPVTPSGTVNPEPTGTRFTPVTPKRVIDTRQAGLNGPKAPLGPATARTFLVAGGTTSVPSDAAAVVINVTGTNNTADTFLTVWPHGQPPTDTSSLNLPIGSTRPNLVTVGVGDGGQIRIYNNSGTTEVIGDVVGYFSDDPGGGLYHPLPPKRVLDTRPGPDNVGAPPGALGTAQTISFAVAGGSTTVPDHATGVVLNTTGANATNGTHLTVYPAGDAEPDASNLNLAAHIDSANLVMVGVGDDLEVSVRNNTGDAQVIADVVGYFAPGTPDDVGTAQGEVTTVQPRRIVDSRPGPENQGTPPTRWGPGETRTLVVTGGDSGVPSTATAVIVNLTAVVPSTATHLRSFPAGTGLPNASSINLPAGDVRANLAVVGTDAQGRIQLYNNAGTVDVLVDVVGYVRAGDAPPP